MMLKLLLIALFSERKQQEQCSTPNYKPGLCAALSSCPVVAAAFSNPEPNTEFYLSKFLCPNKSDDEVDIVVCCPIFPNFNIYEKMDKIVQMPEFSTKSFINSTAQTDSLNGTENTFMHINHIKNLHSQFVTETSFDDNSTEVNNRIYSRRSLLRENVFTTATESINHITPIVEQSQPSNIHKTEDLNNTVYHDKKNTEVLCGKETKLQCGVNKSEIIVHKWLGKLVANNFNDSETFICSAILINEIYAIITKDCVQFLRIFRTKYYFSVRFGDYETDRNMLNKDCNITEDFGIEDVIPYRGNMHNVALIRLRNNFKTLNNISSICLFNANSKNKNLEENIFFPHSDIKPVIKQFFDFDNEKTATTLKNISSTYVENAISQLLIPGEGIPLVYSQDNRWYLYGLSSQNSNASSPGRYSRTGEYIDWIQQTVRPRLGEQCFTPNHKMGTCKRLRECPHLQEAFSNPLKVEEDYLKEFVCQNASYTIDVCCNENFTVFDNKTHPLEKSIEKVKLPNLRFCGYQHRDDYFSDNQNISIHEFPWIARIISSVSKKTLCNGSLINKRYVLSTASCNNVSLLNSALARLGEFNINTERDCVELENFRTTECSTVQDYGIQKVIIHPFFELLSHLNDIMLLRLDKEVIYNDYIRPICLPMPKIKRPKLGDTLYASGFGFNTIQDGQETILKKKLTVKLEPNETCKLEFGSGTYSAKGELYTICTRSSELVSDSLCVGDQGGPIMFEHKYQWHLEGLLSYIYCEYTPIQIHVRVSAYLDWIQENLEQ